MSIRKYKSSSNIVTIALVLCILFVLVLGMVKLSGGNEKPPAEPANTEPQTTDTGIYSHITSDPKAESGPLPGFEDKEKTSPDNVLGYRLNEKPYFATGEKEGEVLIENVKGNYYLMQVEYVYGDSVVVYETGYLKPGEHIKNALLSSNMGEGRHDAVAVIYAIDPETMDIVDVVEHPITISIGA